MSDASIERQKAEHGQWYGNPEQKSSDPVQAVQPGYDAIDHTASGYPQLLDE